MSWFRTCQNATFKPNLLIRQLITLRITTVQVTEKISKIRSKFSLVMVAENFLESRVLLARWLLLPDLFRGPTGCCTSPLLKPLP